MRLVSIVGARPQFIKIAPVSRAIARWNERGRGVVIDDLIVHTGQHYDASMSQIFFDELEIPRPGVNLEVGSGSHGAQTARMLEGIEALLEQGRPDVLVTYGDTNSTIAGALAAAKLHIPTVHVEAGLRSFRRTMPEEVNRIAADHVSDLLLAPTPTAMRNLAAEGLGERAVLAGDVMYDAILFNRRLARIHSRFLGDAALPADGYGLVTLHRAENTEPAPLAALLATLDRVAREELPLVLPLHPRTRAVIARTMPDWRPAPQLRLVEPLSYLDLLQALENARLVLTDSGGLQKEAFFMGRPCITLRGETEWVETVEAGGNIVAGTEAARISAAVEHWLNATEAELEFNNRVREYFGDGRAAERVVAAIAGFAAREQRVSNG